MKICCFCEKWASGGIESFLYNVFERFDMKVFELHIVAAEVKESIFTDKLRTHGVFFHELSGNRKNIIQNYSRFIMLLRKENYDVIHLNVYHAISFIYIFLAKYVGIPTRIAHAHNTALRQGFFYKPKLLLHNAAKCLFSGNATAFWACSENAARFTFSSLALLSKGFTIIPAGIETALYRYNNDMRDLIRSRYGWTEAFVIGNVGRLCDQKNQNFLIDVLHAALQKNVACKLLLIGEGEARSMLEQKVDRLGVRDSVIFFGISTHVEQMMCAMDVFVFPSLFEGLGLVAIEAQAMGLPVICSENIPPEAYITPSIFTLPLDAGADAWANSILDCKITSNDREKNRDYLIKAGFDLSNTVRMVVAGYKEML